RRIQFPALKPLSFECAQRLSAELLSLNENWKGFWHLLKRPNAFRPRRARRHDLRLFFGFRFWWSFGKALRPPWWLRHCSPFFARWARKTMRAWSTWGGPLPSSQVPCRTWSVSEYWLAPIASGWKAWWRSSPPPCCFMPRSG